MSNEGGYERFSTTYYQYGADSLLTLSITHNENGINSVKYTYHWYKPNHIKIFNKYGNYEIQKVNKNLIKYKLFNLSENNRNEELFGEVIIDNNKQVITERWYMSPLCEQGILDEKSYWFYFTTDFKNGKINKTSIRTKNGKYRYVIKYNYLD